MRRMTTPSVETRTVTAEDGRELLVEIGGDPKGLAILAHNGTPNTRHLERRRVSRTPKLEA